MFDKWILKTFDHVAGKLLKFIWRQVQRGYDLVGYGIAYERAGNGIIDRIFYRSESCKVRNRYKRRMSAIQNPYLLGSVGA